jgi:hypothetical protein
MNVTRKIIGACLIAFFGLPLLFGITWAVGLIRASLSPEFLTDLPQKVIADLPQSADEFFRAAQDERSISDANTRAWFQAAAKTGISPRDLLEKTGLQDWLRGELSGSLRQVGMVLRGERRPAPIAIDMRPLKAALLHSEFDKFLDATLANLPPCDDRGKAAWTELGNRTLDLHDLPACRPEGTAARDALIAARARAVEKMDDQVEIFEGVSRFPVLPFGFARSITFLSFFLFLIPAAFIFLGSAIADSSPRGFLQWSGGSILAGGVPALILAIAARSAALWGLRDGAWAWNSHWNSDLAALVFDRLSAIPETIVQHLLSPVVSAAAVVCVVGIVLLALSATARGKTPAAPPAGAPAAPVPPLPPKA